MNKLLIKVLIVIWIFIAVLLTGILVYAIAYGRSTGDIFDILKFSRGAVTLQKDQKVSIDNCEKISLDFSSADVVVLTTDESSLRVVQKSLGKLKKEEKFIINKENNNITIKRGNTNKAFNIFHMGLFKQKIQLYIPRSYDKNLELRSSSGNVTFNSDIALNNIKCIQSSGNFRTDYNIKAKEASLNASSGNINVENLDCNDYSIVTSSGNIDINLLSGSGEVNASSGNIKINYKTIADYSNIRANSGNIKITVPKGISFEFDGQCTSGDINSNFDLNYKDKKGNKATGKVGEGPYKKISSKTTSGNINISQVQ